MRSPGAPARWLAGAALVPAVYWLLPSLVGRLAPSLRDQGDFFFPLKLYTADRIRRGELPLWNPLSGAGEPWLANLQSGVFYPPTLFFLLPSPALAAALFLLLHFAIAVWGSVRFLRDEGSSAAAGLAGAAAFAASGFAASLAAYWNHFGAFAYLPALAALARGGLARRSDRLGFAALFALQALAGSPEISGLTLLVSVVFAWQARPAPEGGFAPSGRLRAGRFAVGAILGLLLAAAALVPFAELVVRSDRKTPLSLSDRTTGTAGWSAAASLAGRGSGSSYLPSLAAGSLTLLLAAAGTMERQRRTTVLTLAGIGAAGLLLAAAGPPGAWLRAIPPLDRVRYPSKFLVLPAFSLSILAGFGLDALRFAPALRRTAAAAAFAVAGAGLILFSRQPVPARAVEAAGLLLALGILFSPADRTGAQSWLQGGAALALAASLALAGHGLFRFAPEAELRRPAAEVAYLSSVPGRVLTPAMISIAGYVLRDDRFDTATLRRQRESLLGYTNLLAGVRTIRTAAPLATDTARRIGDEIDAASDPQVPAGAASGRVLWTPSLPPNMGSRKVGEFYRAPINPYRSRLAFVTSYRVERNAAVAWKRAAGGESDWARTVQLDREPSPAPAGAPAALRFAITSITEDLSERVSARVSSGGAGLLVLTDIAYPGWRAEIDGRPADILTADGAFRAVAVPSGSHDVVFRYRPASLLAGGAISVATLALLLALLLAGEPRRPDRIL